MYLTGALLVRGGALLLFASSPSVVKTKLNQHASAGDTTLELVDSVDWKAGEMLAVSISDYYYGEHHNGNNYQIPGDPTFAQTEVVSVAANTNGSNQVTISTPLAHDRWGLLQYVTNTGMSLEQGEYDAPSEISPTLLDERTTIVHLSRGIVIQGADDDHWNVNGFGFHLQIFEASSMVRIDGVQFRRGGQRRAMGRYPVHWHSK